MEGRAGIMAIRAMEVIAEGLRDACWMEECATAPDSVHLLFSMPLYSIANVRK